MSIDVGDLEAHRAILTGHCYRMLGSAVDAEDAVQETMIRAWRGLGRFDGRASLKTWLSRIATNVCLDHLAQRSRRARPVDESPAGWVDDPLETQPRTHWLEPMPDARALPAQGDPYEIAALRQHTRLAFVAALQQLPPRQRAALLLTQAGDDLLGEALGQRQQVGTRAPVLKGRGCASVRRGSAQADTWWLSGESKSTVAFGGRPDDPVSTSSATGQAPDRMSGSALRWPGKASRKGRGGTGRSAPHLSTLSSIQMLPAVAVIVR